MPRAAGAGAKGRPGRRGVERMAEASAKIPVIEVLPPDISPYREGNTGIEYATTLDSGNPGPHVMINALTHGNELCGAHTLCFLFEQQVRPRRGKLTLSFANVEAFSNFDSSLPYASRYVDEDFNRLWSDEVLDGPGQSRELERARAMRPLVAQADYLLDLHSMHFPAPALLIAGLQERSLALARAMGYPAYVVLDEGHKAGKRMRDYNEFAHPAGDKSAMLVECGQHWERSSVEVARATTLFFLRHLDMLDPQFITDHLPSVAEGEQTVIEISDPVTIASEDFRFVEDYCGFEIIERAGSLIAHDGDREIRTPYDDCVLVMPTATDRAKAGQTAVRLGRIVAC